MTDPFPLVERELGLLMRRAKSSAAAVSRRIHPDLDSGAYPLLVHIALAPGVRGSDLAAHFGLGRATISRQLSHLEQLGLVTREPDVSDARGQLLTLTALGQQAVAEARDARRRWLREALTEWSTDDVEALATALARLNTTIDGAMRTP